VTDLIARVRETSTATKIRQILFLPLIKHEQSHRTHQVIGKIQWSWQPHATQIHLIRAQCKGEVSCTATPALSQTEVEPENLS